MDEEYSIGSIFDNEEEFAEESCGESLEAIIRRAAVTMLRGALEAEVTEFLGRLRYEKTTENARVGYRNGYHRERIVTTAAGGVKVAVPRVSESTEKFVSKIVRPYKRRTENLDEAFKRLFVEGLATRDFEPALRALTGEAAPLSPSSISRLNKEFKADYEAWQKRDLKDLKIVYVWVDGVSIASGIADERAHVLVMIGADRFGVKHLLAMSEGYRESKESWTALLRDLKKRGLNQPALAVADGALGFWAALPEVWPQTRKQLCWFHKTKNILDKLPKSEHQEAILRIRGVYLSDSREAAKKLAGQLMKDWRAAGYDKAADCLGNALERLLTFIDFPSEHARHLRTTNPIESSFSTLRLRTDAARRFRTIRSGLHLVFKLFERYQKTWKKLQWPEKLLDVALPA